jgi:hypothetical protein
MSASAATGYSSQVRLHLVVGGRTLQLAEIAPDSLYLRELISIPPCDADVVMHLDGHERRWSVFLPDGIRLDSRLVRTEPRSRVG